MKQQRQQCIHLLFTLFVWVIGTQTWACSTFYIHTKETTLFGKNYDWDVIEGIVLVNKRGVTKTALAHNNPVIWTSKYGSITFNQYGREFPTGGMNEQGLVIEVLWLNGSTYPSSDNRLEIDNMQWVQYQLDNAQSVEEVLASDTYIRIAPLSSATVHYLIGDKWGNCAAIEFVRGKRVYYTGKKLMSATLTNHTYRESIDYLKQHHGFGGKSKPQRGDRSLDRFVRISQQLKDAKSLNKADAVTYGFSILSDVAMGSYTKWRIIYDIKKNQAHFRTGTNQIVKRIDCSKLNYACDSPIQYIPVTINKSENVTALFNPFSQTINRQLVTTTFSKTDFLAGASKEFLEMVITYPSSLFCRNAHD